MTAIGDTASETSVRLRWRHGVTVLVVLAPLALLFSLEPLTDPSSYHDFADRRAFFGIPNFTDVVSSLAYGVAGLWGMATCARMPPASSLRAWQVLFVGVALIGPGSAFYHWDPSGITLIWDRLPMSVGFAGLFVAILSDYISPRFGRLLLGPAVVVGLASVIYGHWQHDLRLYAWVQGLPMIAISAAVLLYPSRYTHRGHMLVAFACYVLAKVAEMHDLQVFGFTAGTVSGHTVKHLLGVLAVAALVSMLRSRRPIAGAPG
jgi:hypothetical protein